MEMRALLGENREAEMKNETVVDDAGGMMNVVAGSADEMMDD
jgi:hypothetical protein